jgi:hypothetical protein
MKTALITAGMSVALATAALAQGNSQMGILSGVVLDAGTQKPIAEAVVSAHGAALVGEQSVTTDENGAFEMTMLPSGVYGLTVKRDGYPTFAPEGIDVKGRRVRLKLTLAPREAEKAPTPVAEVANAPEFDAASMTAPVMISGPAPEYSPEAIERGVEGQIVLRCLVTSEGAVRLCKIQKGLPFMNTPCITALEARKYKPATQAGKPVDVLYTFNIRLKLPR